MNLKHGIKKKASMVQRFTMGDKKLITELSDLVGKTIKATSGDYISAGIEFDDGTEITISVTCACGKLEIQCDQEVMAPQIKTISLV